MRELYNFVPRLFLAVILLVNALGGIGKESLSQRRYATFLNEAVCPPGDVYFHSPINEHAALQMIHDAILPSVLPLPVLTTPPPDRREVIRAWERQGAEFQFLTTNVEIAQRANDLERLDQEFGTVFQAFSSDEQIRTGFSSEFRKLLLSFNWDGSEKSEIPRIVEYANSAELFGLILADIDRHPVTYQRIDTHWRDLLTSSPPSRSALVAFNKAWGTKTRPHTLMYRLRIALQILPHRRGKDDVTDYLRLFLKIAQLQKAKRIRLMADYASLQARMERKVLWQLMHVLPGVKNVRAFQRFPSKFRGRFSILLNDPAQFGVRPQRVFGYRGFIQQGDLVAVQVLLERIHGFDLTLPDLAGHSNLILTLNKGRYPRREIFLRKAEKMILEQGSTALEALSERQKRLLFAVRGRSNLSLGNEFELAEQTVQNCFHEIVAVLKRVEPQNPETRFEIRSLHSYLVNRSSRAA